MGAPENEHIFGVQIRESANDGSDFTNADADYRKFFVGEDGSLHLKDSAGTVTDFPAGGGSGIPATIFDAKGDIIVATAADTAARQAVGANGTVLMAASGQTNGIRWTPGLYVAYPLARAAATTTENINSTAYLDSFLTGFSHDWDVFPATHFQITAVAFANAVATVTLQLTPFGSPTNPVSAAGDDLAITNNGGALTFVDSGWIAVSDAMSGIDHLQLAMKGSSSTVDLTYRWINCQFKIAT